jgi:undecaprenyl-diphosphatase
MSGAIEQTDPLFQKWKRRFCHIDLELVRFVAVSARPRVMRSSAIWVSRLGNGWVYIFIVALVFERLGKRGWPVILVAAVNAAAIHCIYPAMKRRIGRPRPCHADPSLISLLRTLDEHSFPSGHIMTLAATLVPVMFMTPGTAVLGTVLMVLMSWARIATAHHYPSDVFGGAVLGIVFGSPLTIYFFSTL